MHDTVFSQLLEEAGLKSGVVFVSRLLKGHEARLSTIQCGDQESIRPMSERIQKENNCYLDGKKAALASGLNVNALENMTSPSIPLFNQPDKGVHTDG
jgi:hypothetical protein